MLTYDQLIAELWQARKRFKKDGELVNFLAGWIWSHMGEEWKKKR